MTFERIIGHAAAIRSLLSGALAGRISNAYLFSGNAGIGRTSLCLAYAAYLNCLDAGADDACGRCISCRKIEQGVHPDVKVLRPEKGSIKIAAVREVIRDCSYQPYEGRWKVYIVDGADRLGEEAANALLKTLEETPERTLFLLVAEGTSGVLPTIVSRCRIVELQAPAREELVAALERLYGFDNERAVAVCRDAAGLPATALAMAGGQGASADEAVWQELISHLNSGDTLRALRAAEIMQRLLHENRDAVQGEERADNLCRMLDGLCRRYMDRTMDEGGCMAVRVVTLAEEAKAALRLNTNPQLTLESFALQLIEGESP